jgi:hypothetical protein
MSDDYQMDDTQRNGGPTSELELYSDVAEPSTEDDFLSDNNLGLGKYSGREYWQQIEAFKNHMYSESAFGRKLSELAIYQTQYGLGKEALENQDEYDSFVDMAQGKGILDDDDIIGRRQAIIAIGKHRWNTLLKERYTENARKQMDDREAFLHREQLRAVEEHAGSSEWLTPHSRMISARHEGSRSKDAHLIDNLFGRVREQRQETDIETARSNKQDGGVF